MIDWLLLHLFHRHTLDLDVIARRLAEEYLAMFAPEVSGGAVGPSMYQDWCRTRYMQMAMRWGLPGNAQRKVAELSWGYIRDAGKAADEPDYAFSFYE